MVGLKLVQVYSSREISTAGRNYESAAPALRLEKLDQVCLVGRKAFPRGTERFHAVSTIAGKTVAVLVVHRDDRIDRP
jgi:hypothetical protein